NTSSVLTSSVITPTIQEPPSKEDIVMPMLKPTSFIFPSVATETILPRPPPCSPQVTHPPPPYLEESLTAPQQKIHDVSSLQGASQTSRKSEAQMKDAEVEEGDIVKEVGDEMHDQMVEISSVPESTEKKNIEDIDIGTEEEIKEELIRKNMVELGGVLQQESTTEEPKKQLEIVALPFPEGSGKEIIVHPEAQTLSGQEFTNWLTKQSFPTSKEVIDLEEMDLQLLRRIEKKRKRPKMAK
ncbi:hypothetical protein KI387_040337, partial [Taxus chinensis]